MPGLIDLHAHPTLKMYYLPHIWSFRTTVPNGGFRNPFSFRTAYPHLCKGNVKVMLCTHYILERGFMRFGVRPWARVAQMIAWPIWYVPRITEDPWKTLIANMDLLEEQIEYVNKTLKPGEKRLRLVTAPDQIDTLADDEIGLVHTIEGAHVFGEAPDRDQTLDEYMERTRERLTILQSRGLALITLAHFWDNMFAPQTDGTELVPSKKRGRVVPVMDDLVVRMKRATWRWEDPEHLCEPFARELLERGILIDLAHTQEHARQEVYRLCEEYRRPVTMTHVGLQHFYPHEYNASDDEIRTIHRLGGVLGLIFSMRLLQHPVKLQGYVGGGLEFLAENVRYVKDLVGDVTCLGIGTDFDGLTDPFKDCYDSGMMGAVGDTLAKHFSDAEVEQVLYGNSLRLLKQGWGPISGA